MCIINIIGLVMLIGGIYALIKGELAFSKTTKITGGKARILGALMLMPLPASIVAGMVYGIFLTVSRQQINDKDPMFIALGVVPIVIFAALTLFLGMKWAD